MPTPTTTDETDPDELAHWMNTEGIRRLEAMKADPAQCLTHEEFWSVVEADEHWLRTTGVERYDAYDRNPEDVYTSEQIMKSVADHLATLPDTE